MHPRNILGRFASLLSNFARERRGFAAVEFALVLPVMLVLYLGGVEISQEVSVARLTSLTASTVANLVCNTRPSAPARRYPTFSTRRRPCSRPIRSRMRS